MLKRTEVQHSDSAVNCGDDLWNRSSVLQCIAEHLVTHRSRRTGCDSNLGHEVAAIAETLRAGSRGRRAPRNLPFWLVAVFVDGTATTEEADIVLEAIQVDNSVLAEVVAATKAKLESNTSPPISSELSNHLKMLPWLKVDETVHGEDLATPVCASEFMDLESPTEPMVEITPAAVIDLVCPSSYGSSNTVVDPSLAIDLGVFDSGLCRTQFFTQVLELESSEFRWQDTPALVQPPTWLEWAAESINSSTDHLKNQVLFDPCTSPHDGETIASTHTGNYNCIDGRTNSTADIAATPSASDESGLPVLTAKHEDVDLLSRSHPADHSEIDVPALHIVSPEATTVMLGRKVIILVALLVVLLVGGTSYLTLFPDERLERVVGNWLNGTKSLSEEERLKQLIKENEELKSEFAINDAP